jgi:hypothetical protein
MDPPRRILGLKLGNSKNEIGLIRIKLKKASFWMSLLNTVYNSIFSVDGFLPNFVLSLINFIMIIIVPLVSPVITFLALSEMTTF